jgi:DNA-binding NarL/FixJ family response regulator
MNVAGREKVQTSPKGSQRKTVLVVASLSLFREGLKAIIALSSLFDVVALARTAEEALDKAVRTRPALVLLDLCLPDCGGVDLIHGIHKRLPGTRIMVVSPDARPERITAAVEAGASGFLQWSSQAERLTQCLELISAGGFCVDDRTVLDLARNSSSRPEDRRRAGMTADGHRLSGREAQVLQGMAEGRTLKALAQELQISLKTVENHRTRLVNKLGLHTAVDVVRYAARAGLINLEEWKEGR